MMIDNQVHFLEIQYKRTSQVVNQRKSNNKLFEVIPYSSQSSYWPLASDAAKLANDQHISQPCWSLTWLIKCISSIFRRSNENDKRTIKQRLADNRLTQITFGVTLRNARVNGVFEVAADNVKILPDFQKYNRHARILTLKFVCRLIL